MTPEILNAISFFMALVLCFCAGVGYGQYIAHRRFVLAVGAVQNTASNIINMVLKGAKNAKISDLAQPPGDSGGFVVPVFGETVYGQTTYAGRKPGDTEERAGSGGAGAEESGAGIGTERGQGERGSTPKKERVYGL